MADTLLLSRLQFAANMSFHILFPSISIALAWILLFFRVRHLRAQGTPEASEWEHAWYFWTKVFALTFALGVVSGITMSFQFGTNWPGFMEHAGNIAGPLLGYEVLTAFFLEASFLAIMLFGRQRVSARTHLVATFLVALGTTLSAFWILALDSWMQTPAAYTIVDGRFHATSWWGVIFNPSFPYRFVHKLLASTLTAAFLVAGLSAWQVLKGTANGGTRRALRAGVVTAAVAIPLQILAGDMHGLNTLHHQPAKIAALEAIWQTERGVPLTLIGWPDEEAGTTRFALRLPKAGSLILAHDADAEIQGLDRFAGAHPPVAPVFFAFRAMVGMGLLMLLVSWWSAWHMRGGRALPRRVLHTLAAMTFSGWVATLAGWYVTEIGRQPFVVYGLLRTADVVARHPPAMVAATLAAYLALYVMLLLSYVGVLKYMAEHPGEPAPVQPLPVDSAAVARGT
ncbi:MAG TPA: cytochrome ubiquinol oxidase subunit I [Ramlibacter sp.]|uniref:cytochrome ubiquinol oxidase subunit I n=1 Tax=Ramlibacter sp. TaxID=1917967 RepID=UPI002C5C915B|nr:cytochrome ubiquinol oxidase subunit I [Ramlibacter sp.]HVZ45641.1 cytochrome ubiquinol oxidase subunit I [Ramlibacter sp.]